MADATATTMETAVTMTEPVATMQVAADPPETESPLPPTATRTSRADQSAVVGLHTQVARRCRPEAGQDAVTARFTVVVDGGDVRRVIFDGALPSSVRACVERQANAASGFDDSMPARRFSLEVGLQPAEPATPEPSGGDPSP